VLGRAALGILVLVAAISVIAGIRGHDPTGTASAGPGAEANYVPVCKGSVRGLASAPATVLPASDGGVATGARAEPGRVVVLARFPARSHLDPYVGQQAWVRLGSGAVQVSSEVSGAQYDDSGSVLIVSVSVVHASTQLVDGEPLTVSLLMGISDDTFYVPTSLVRHSGGRAWVRVVRGGRQISAGVDLGLAGDGRTEIVSGLRSADLLVLPAGARAGCGR
jgi:hypothetical protein